MKSKSPKGKLHVIHTSKTNEPEDNIAPSNLRDLIHQLTRRLDQLEGDTKKNLEHLQYEMKQQKKPTDQALEKEIDQLNTNFKSQVHEITNTLQKSLDVEGKHQSSISKIIKKIKSYIPFLGWLPPLNMPQSPQEIMDENIDAFGRDPAFEEKCRFIFDFFYHRYWRIQTYGLENVPSHGRALIVANHSGTLAYDGSMIRMAVSADHPSGRDVRFLVEDFVYYLPFIGTFMYRVGGVRASRDNAEQLLKTGNLVAVFPEGVKGIGKYFSQRYHLQRFGRGGFIKLALRTKSPIIPVAVIGAEEIHPILYKSSFLAKPLGIPYIPITPTLPWLGPLGLIPLPTKWSIHFGEPIDLSSYGSKTLNDELQIHQLSEMVRQRIQNMITEALKKRRSIWFG